MKKSTSITKKEIALVALTAILFSPMAAFAAPQTLGDIAANILKSIQSVGTTVQGFAYVASFIIAVWACFKFVAYARDTEREKLSTPFMLLGIAAVLFAVPMVLDSGTVTIWGGNTQIKQSAHSDSILP